MLQPHLAKFWAKIYIAVGLANRRVSNSLGEEKQGISVKIPEKTCSPNYTSNLQAICKSKLSEKNRESEKRRKTAA